MSGFILYLDILKLVQFKPEIMLLKRLLGLLHTCVSCNFFVFRIVLHNNEVYCILFYMQMC